MIGRLRPADLLLGIAGTALFWALFELPVVKFAGVEQTAWESLAIIRWLVLAVAGVAVEIPIAVVVRRTATAALALSALEFWISILALAVLIFRLLLVLPSLSGVDGEPMPGAAALLAIVIVVGVGLFLSLKDERRGLRAGPGAPVIRIDSPAVDAPEQSG